MSDSEDMDILRLADQWRDKWTEISTSRYMPHELGQQLSELNDIARRLAAEATSRRLNHEEYEAVASIQHMLLVDELHSPIIRRAV